MREYKFRAWDKEEQRFWYFTLQEILERKFSYTGTFDDKIMRGEKTQYTGVKDINGKEIYEKDILKDSEGNLYIVDFIRGCFYLKTRYEKNGEWLEWLPMSEITRLAEPENFYRIGNIYENPELLA